VEINDDDDEDDVDGRASVTKDEERVLRGG